MRRLSRDEAFAYASREFSSVGVYHGPARRSTVQDEADRAPARPRFLLAGEALSANTSPRAAVASKIVRRFIVVLSFGRSGNGVLAPAALKSPEEDVLIRPGGRRAW
jgi:hypothetical protein